LLGTIDLVTQNKQQKMAQMSVDEEKNFGVCGVCQELLLVSENLNGLPCCHIFHTECLEELSNNTNYSGDKYKDTYCPSCNTCYSTNKINSLLQQGQRQIQQSQQQVQQQRQQTQQVQQQRQQVQQQVQQQRQQIQQQSNVRPSENSSPANVIGGEYKNNIEADDDIVLRNGRAIKRRRRQMSEEEIFDDESNNNNNRAVTQTIKLNFLQKKLNAYKLKV